MFSQTTITKLIADKSEMSALSAECLLTTDLITESIEQTRENQRQLNHVPYSINLLGRIYSVGAVYVCNCRSHFTGTSAHPISETMNDNAFDLG